MICQSDMAGKEPAATCGAQGVHLSLRTGMYGKALGLLLFLGMLSVTVFPQSKKSELNVGYGLFGSSRAIEKSAEYSADGLSAGMTSAERTFTGAFHVEYKYRDDVTQHLPMTVWAAFMYEGALSATFAGNAAAGRFNDSFYTVLGGVDLIYVNRPKFLMYGVMGAGFTVCTRRFASDEDGADTVGIVHLNFQLSLLCIKYGENAGVFAEFGVGSKGIVCAGMFVRL